MKTTNPTTNQGPRKAPLSRRLIMTKTYATLIDQPKYSNLAGAMSVPVVWDKYSHQYRVASRHMLIWVHMDDILRVHHI